MVGKHCGLFYIRANRCAALYDDIIALRGWKTEEVEGASVKLNFILVERWKGKTYRLVIQGKGNERCFRPLGGGNTRIAAY